MNSRSILFLNDFPKKLIPCGVSQQKLDNLKKKNTQNLEKDYKTFYENLYINNKLNETFNDNKY
jgi:cytidine deaminase